MTTSPVSDVSNIFFSAFARRPIRRRQGQYAWLTNTVAVHRYEISTRRRHHLTLAHFQSRLLPLSLKRSKPSRCFDTVVIQVPWDFEAGQHHEVHEVPRRAFPAPQGRMQYMHSTIYTLFLQMEHLVLSKSGAPPLEPPSQLGDRRLQVAPAGRVLLRQSSIAGSRKPVRHPPSVPPNSPSDGTASRETTGHGAHRRGLTCLAPADDGSDGSSTPPKPLPNRAWCIYGSRKHGGSASQSTSRLGRAPLTKRLGGRPSSCAREELHLSTPWPCSGSLEKGRSSLASSCG